MKFYRQSTVERVREQRKKGASLRELERRFAIPNTTISRWVRDIASKDKMFKRAKAREQESKLKFDYLLKDIKITKNQARIFAGLLYWCEGYKYPSSNFVGFSNSDPYLIKTFLMFLRLGFNLDERKIRVHLQLHTTHHERKMKEFWSDLLKISLKQFHKSTVTVPTKNMKRRNYNGTCTIKYFDVKLLFQLTGIFESLVKKMERYPSG